MNMVKRSLVRRRIKDGIKVSREIEALVKALSIPTFDFLARPWPVSSFYSPVGLARRLMQELY